MLPVVLAVLLLAYAVRGMPLTALLSQFGQASVGWIGVVAVIMGGQITLRAVRWRMLLQGLGYATSVGRAMSVTLAGGVSGLLIPGSGELLRCTLLQRADNVPITESVGSIITERLVDLLATAFFLILTLLLESSRLLAYLRQYWLAPAWLSSVSGKQWVGIAGALLLLAVSMYLGVRRLLEGDTYKQLNQRLRIGERLNGFRRGLLSIRSVGNPALYWLITFVANGLSLLVLIALFRALPSTANVPNLASLTIFSLTSLGSLTIPTQASIGSYHFLASRGLVAYGVPILTGTIWATFSHAIITLVNLGFSALGFLAAFRFMRGKQTYKVSETL